MGQTMSVLNLDQNLLETLSNSTQIEACVILIMTGQSLLNGQHVDQHVLSLIKIFQTYFK